MEARRHPWLIIATVLEMLQLCAIICVLIREGIAWLLDDVLSVLDMSNSCRRPRPLIENDETPPVVDLLPVEEKRRFTLSPYRPNCDSSSFEIAVSGKSVVWHRLPWMVS